jgi:hypothetical protein
VQSQFRYINTVNQDLSVSTFDDTEQGQRKTGFSSAGSADNADFFSSDNFEIDSVEY